MRILLVLAVAALPLLVLAPSCTHGRGEGAAGVSVQEVPSWREGRMAGVPTVWSERGAWIGEDGCRVCHEDRYREMESVVHRTLMREGDGLGCEACHGPAEKHSDDDEDSATIDAFARLDRAAVEQRCARCHFEDLRAIGVKGPHASVASQPCTECHRVHVDAPPRWPVEAAADGRCTSCHVEAVVAHLRSDHASLMAGEDAVGCEACHGDATEHLRQGGKPGTIRVPDRTEQESLCVDCHARDRTLGRWRGSDHARSGTGCLDCHDLLGDPTAPISRREPQVCGRCHAAETASFALPNRHPVLEGAMRCTSCHAAHGGRSSPSARRRLDGRCVDCHRNTAGPFVFEHEADRVDGCGACHAPHGSPNRRLLKQWPVQNLCLQCHATTPASHDIGPASLFRDCIRCHTEVHGSDLDRHLFR